MELLPSLVAGLKAVCATFPDGRKGRGGNIAMADFGLSALAMFFMQSASFLSFQRRLEQGHGRSNCQTLFGIEKIPSDNYIRDMLEGADPALLQPCFARVEQLLAEPASAKPLEDWAAESSWPGTEPSILLAEYRLPALPDAQTFQWQGRELSQPDGGDGGGTGAFQGGSAVSRVHRHARRRREAGLRTQRRQTLVPKAWRKISPIAAHLSRRRHLRLPAHRQNAQG